MTDPAPKPDGIAPLKQQEIRLSERETFRDMAAELFKAEMEDQRERRGEFGAVEEEQSYANAAARALAMAGWFVVIRRDFEEQMIRPVKVSPPRCSRAKVRRRRCRRGRK